MTEENTELHKSLYSDIAIAVDDANECLASVQSSILQPIVKTFAKNTYTILSMLAIPVNSMEFAIRFAQAEVDRFSILTAKGYSPEQISNLSEIDKSVRLEVADMIVTKLRAEVQNVEARKRLLSTLHSKIITIIEEGEDDFRTSMQALLYSTTILAWTTFETLASDLWETTVNAYTLKLWKPVIEAQPSKDHSEPEGFAKKQVEIGMLAKHGFDLRNVMGSIMKPKFDFTSAANILSIYRTTFGVNQELADALGNNDLAKLEYTRNLLAHKAGIVDEEFKRKTGSQHNIGEPISLNGATVSHLANTGIKAGCALVKFVDNWIATQDS